MPVDTVDDSIDENEESFTASLSNQMGSGLPFELGDDDTATVNIMDTDSKYVCGFPANVDTMKLERSVPKNRDTLTHSGPLKRVWLIHLPCVCRCEGASD